MYYVILIKLPSITIYSYQPLSTLIIANPYLPLLTLTYPCQPLSQQVTRMVQAVLGNTRKNAKKKS